MDQYSGALCNDNVIRHNNQELYKVYINKDFANNKKMQEGDIIGVSYDHIQLKFYINGIEIDYSITNVKGTVYPALYGELVFTFITL